MEKKATGIPTRILLRAALLSIPALAQAPYPTAHPARPGSINYVEGQVSIGTVPLTVGGIGIQEVEKDQSVETQVGKVEILLSPGVLLRLADNSSLKMISSDLINTEVQLEKGRAMVEVIDIHPENNLRIDQNGASVRLVKKGIYDFDANRCEIRVFSGSAHVAAGKQAITVGNRQRAALDTDGLKSLRFEPRAYEDDFYRWSGLRSGYLSEASVDAARVYVGPGPGGYGSGWTGLGWYWSPWFGVYTFLPAEGVFAAPFGWAFYSPIAVYWSPYVYYGHYMHRFEDFHYPYGHGFAPPGAHPGRMGR